MVPLSRKMTTATEHFTEQSGRIGRSKLFTGSILAKHTMDDDDNG